jgi:hypothetical protein
MIQKIPIGDGGCYFKQHGVVIKDSIVVLHDHRRTAACPGAVTIAEGQVSRANVADRDFPNCLVADGPLQQVVHAICHIDTNRTNIQFFDPTCAQFPKVIALHVSSTPQSGSDHASDNSTVWLSMKDGACYRDSNDWLPEFLSLDFRTAKDLVEIAKVGDRSNASEYESEFAHLLDIILPGRVEHSLAFRLLCEAQKCMKIDGKSDCVGIEIHSPEGIDQWLDPFGRKQGTDLVATAKAIDEVSSLIGSGTIKNKAKAVLHAVNGSGKLSEAIDDFLKEVATPNP